MNYKNKNSMNVRHVLTQYVWSTTWMNSTEKGIRTQALFFFFFYNIKQHWPHLVDQPDGNPCNNTPATHTHCCPDTNIWAKIFSCQSVQRWEEWGGCFQTWERCQCLLFFDFLWDLWGDFDLERDFFVDFLGVLDRDLFDRLGVRGEDGDLSDINKY